MQTRASTNNLFDLYHPLNNLLAFNRLPQHTTPTADVRKTETGYQLQVDLPGFNKDEVSIELKDRVLSISAAHEETEDEEKNAYIVRERTTHLYTRRFSLPTRINVEDIDAALEDGVLTVKISTNDDTGVQRISIA